MAINVARYQVPPASGVQVGTDGNNTFSGSASSDTVQLDAGFRSSVVTNGPNGPRSVTSAAGVDSFSNISGLIFVDGREVYDRDDHAAQVSRLYDIVLNRTADQDGLNSYIGHMDDGVPMDGIADSLIGSSEFTNRSGTNLTDAQFVQVLYNNMRGANASAAEVSFWTWQMTNNAMSRADVATSFANSTEGMNANAAILSQGIWDRDENAISIANLYDTAFNRRPELDGLAHWVSQINSIGTSMEGISELIYTSIEAQNAFSSLTDRDFVNAIYQNALNRVADASGADFWSAQLASGSLSRSDVMLAISDSAEHQAITAEAVQSDNPQNYGILLFS